MATSELLIAACLARLEPATLRLAAWQRSEPGACRSAQLYGVRAEQVEAAARFLVGSGEEEEQEEEDNDETPLLTTSPRVREINVNFGCPVKKITSRGGGAALAARPRLFASLVRAAVRGAQGRAAVTAKLRVGLSSDSAPDTCFEAGLIAAAEGVSAVALHARRAEQGYAPPVDLSAASRLVERLSRGSGGGSGRDAVPVIYNGDVCTGKQAVEAMRRTGAGAVMVGRGAIGRPWAFAGIKRAMMMAEGGGGEEEEQEEPTLGEALQVALRHARLWAEHEAWLDEREGRGGGGGGGGLQQQQRRRRRRTPGESPAASSSSAEARAMLKMRRLWPLYTLGHDEAVRDLLLRRLMAAATIDEAAAAVREEAEASAFAARPAAWAATAPRLKTGPMGAVQRVSLPHDWLSCRLDEEPPDYLMDEAAEG